MTERQHPALHQHDEATPVAVRAAEAFARSLGSVPFILGQTAFIIGWITLNVVAVVGRWDPYPFILLNLTFSTQAAYAAPLILLAQNRQAEKDRAQAAHDYEINAEALRILRRLDKRVGKGGSS